MSTLVGRHLGKYRITAELGQGGMATVYRAHDASAGRDVAIKVLDPKYIQSPDFVKRFRREAQTIARLSHPNILKVYDFGQREGLIYLVMELIPGGSLSNRIKSKPISDQEVRRLLKQIASALDYAHRQGVIHRDLKPQNVLLNKDGNAVLTDFGIAKVLGETTHLTQTGMAMGTPAYMAPEQWRGGTIDNRIDIYALGIILFEMLTGKLPFNGTTPYNLMHMHIYEPPPSLWECRNDLPVAVDAVIAQALAKEPDQRYESATGLVQAFENATNETDQAQAAQWQDQFPTVPDMEPSPDFAGSPRRGARWLILPAAGIVLIALVVVGFIALSNRSHEVAAVSTATLPGTTATVNLPAAYAVTTKASSPTVVAAVVSSSATSRPSGTPAPLSTATFTVQAASNTPAPVIKSATNTQKAIPAVTYTLPPGASNTLTPTAAAVGMVWQPKTWQSADVAGVAFSPDGKEVITGSLDKTARLWGMQSGTSLRTFSGHSGLVTSVAFSPDGKRILTGSADKTARLWDVESGSSLRTFSGHSDLVMSVAFSPDGKRILTGSADKTARLWDVESGTSLRTFSGHSDLVMSVAFSPDGKRILTGSADKTARLWDAETGALLHTLTGHTDFVTSVTFAPDGKLALTGSWDQTARLWDTQTGQTLTTLTGHSGSITAVDFAPDGKTVLTGSTDATIRLWDIQTGQTLSTFTSHTGQITALAFSPDGKAVVTASTDQSVRLWVLPGRQ